MEWSVLSQISGLVWPTAAGASAHQTHLIIVAALFGAVNILWLVVLSILVVVQRQKGRIATGDGGNPALRNAIRAHANHAEYIAAALASFIFLALLGASSLLLHILAGGFTLGRILSGIGLSTNAEKPLLTRVIGTVLTFVTLALMGIAILFYALHAHGLF